MVVWLSMGTIVWAQQPPGPLQLTLETNREPVSLSRGVVRIIAILRNSDNNRRVVLRGSPGYSNTGGLSVHITDPAGVRRTIEPTVGILTPEQARVRDRRVLLPPNTSMAIPRIERASRLFPTPGQYRIQISYQNPLPSAVPVGVGSNDIEDAQAESAVVTLTVVP